MDDIHFSSETGEWGTPPEVIEAGETFNNGAFDFDPCGHPDYVFANQTVMLPEYAKHVQAQGSHIVHGDSLTLSWKHRGLVYCNPPYGRQIAMFLGKAHEADEFIGLIPARPDTKWFHAHVWPADVVIFVKGRLHFSGHKDAAPFPSVLYYWAPTDTTLAHRIDLFVECFGHFGKVLIQP